MKTLEVGQETLTLPQADLGWLAFWAALLSCSSSSARPHVLHGERSTQSVIIVFQSVTGRHSRIFGVFVNVDELQKLLSNAEVDYIKFYI